MNDELLIELCDLKSRMIILKNKCLCVKRNSGRKAVEEASDIGDVTSATFHVPVKCEHLCYKPPLALY